MPVIRLTAAGSHQSMSDCFFPSFLNRNLALLQGTEEQDAKDWINRYIFDEALKRPSRAVNVTEAVRQHIPNHPNWTGSPLQPLHDQTGKDEDNTKWIYGNLVCRVGVIHRPETWWVFKCPVGHNQHSSTYVLSHI
jgi:hypothetical protein